MLQETPKILQNITENLDKVQPLLDTCDEAYTILSEQKYDEFLNLLNKSWQQKKLTSSSVTENEKIKEIDSVLEDNETVCAHKLCGAGNGGFFCVFQKVIP